VTSPRADDHRTARELAQLAGELLVTLRAEGVGSPPDVLKSLGDQRSHEFLMRELASRCRGDAVLSEEGADDPARLGARRLWIVDPLDGTREFGELGRTDWAVHVALVEDGRLTAGAVALPARRRVYATNPVEQVAEVSPRPLRLAVSRTRPAAESTLLATRLEAELVPMGSAGVKAMAVVSGEVDIYAHSGGQYAWDSAAPVAVAQAAGLHATRLDGSPLIYGGETTWLPDLLICRPELADEVLNVLTEGTDE
jgi:3'(2'), 5'-bisphosphate nucleotidase